MACKMIENGVDPKSTASAVQKFAYFYRRKRVCDSAIKMKDSNGDYENYDKYLAKFNRSGNEGKPLSLYDFLKTTKYANSDHELFISATKRDENAIYRYFASKIYANGTGCKVASGFNDAMMAGGAGDSSIFSDVLYLPSNVDEQCERIAGIHCAKTKHILDTWDADFKWTMEQQKVGAEFAAKHCVPAKELNKYQRPAVCSDSLAKGMDKELSGSKFSDKLKFNKAADTESPVIDEESFEKVMPLLSPKKTGTF